MQSECSLPHSQQLHHLSLSCATAIQSTPHYLLRIFLLLYFHLIIKVSKCSITTNELRTLPELHGEIQSTIDNIHFYIPDHISVVADHEITLIKETSSEILRLDDVKSQVVMLSQDFDVDSFSHIRQSSLRQTHQTCWHLMATTSICVVDILEILYLSLHFSLRDMATCCFSSITVPEPSTTEQNPSSLPPEPRRRAYTPNKTILRRISP